MQVTPQPPYGDPLIKLPEREFVADAQQKPNLAGMSREEMRASLTALGLEPFRAKQVWSWVYHHGVTDFERMTTINKPARALLAEHFALRRPDIAREMRSADGTRKWLLRLQDDTQVEVVYIPEEERGTLCISSQVGCTLSCTFCHTGTQRLVRNLTAEEIVGQVMLARDALGEWPSPNEGRLLSNIVLMGMGEPLFNYDNIAKAMRIIMDAEGISLSKRKITLSTSGVVPMMGRCGAELGLNLAISLHAVTDELRNEIVPINRKWPISALMQACRDYPTLSNARRITFEYVMLKDVNDSDEDARALVRLIEGIPAKLNLIPFNPWPGSPYACSSNNRIHAFASIIMAAGYPSPIRKTRGQDILAACGQLKSDSERKKKH